MSLWIARLILFVGPLLFFTRLTENPYSVQITLIQTGVALLLILKGLSFLKSGRIAITRTPLDLPLLFLGMSLGVSSLLSWVSHPVFFRQSISSSAVHALTFAATNVVGVFFISSQTVAARERELAHRLIVGVTTVAAAYGLLQSLGWDPLWGSHSGFGRRPISTFGNPNFLSTTLVLVFPVLVHACWTARTARTSLALGVLSLVHGAALLATQTRSSWLGVLAGTALYGFLRRPASATEKKRCGILLLFLSLLIAGWPLITLGRGGAVWSHLTALWGGITGPGVYASWHQRLLIWAATIDLWRDAPFFGKGAGTFEVFFPFTQARWLAQPVFVGLRTHANNAHQFFLDFAAQTGGVGLGLVLWSIAVTVVWTWKHRQRLSQLSAGRTAACLAGVFGVLVDNAFGNVSLFFSAPALLTFWVLGQSFSAQPLEPTPLRRTPLNALGALVLVLGLLGMAAGSLARFSAEISHFRGRRLLQSGDPAGAERAFRRAGRWTHDVRHAFDHGNTQAHLARVASEQGLAHLALEHARSAVALYDRAQRANPGYDEIPLNRAHWRAWLGDEAQAFQDRRFALLINPLNRDNTLRVVADPLFAPLSKREKENILGSAVQFHPDHPWLLKQWARELERGGRAADAAAVYDRVLRLDLDDPDAWAGTSRCRGSGPSQDVKDARELLRLLRTASPTDPRGRARALARVMVLRALAPHYPWGLLIQADLLVLNGRSKEAEPLYREFLQKVPSHADARRRLADLLRAADRRPETGTRS